MKRVLFALGLAFSAVAPASAATLINGGFEDGVPGNVKGLNNNQTFSTMPNTGGGWDRWKAINGWTTESGTGIEIQTDRTLGDVAPKQGKYYVELDSDGNSAMTQSVWLERGKYLLSFWYSPRSKPGQSTGELFRSNGIAYSVGSVSGSISGPSTQFDTAIGKWTRVTAKFIADVAQSYTVRFAATGTNNTYGGLIDDVSLDYVAPVPVPAAGLLLLGGLGGLAALKRRRKA